MRKSWMRKSWMRKLQVWRPAGVYGTWAVLMVFRYGPRGRGAVYGALWASGAISCAGADPASGVRRL